MVSSHDPQKWDIWKPLEATGCSLCMQAYKDTSRRMGISPSSLCPWSLAQGLAEEMSMNAPEGTLWTTKKPRPYNVRWNIADPLNFSRFGFPALLWIKILFLLLMLLLEICLSLHRLWDNLGLLPCCLLWCHLSPWSMFPWYHSRCLSHLPATLEHRCNFHFPSAQAGSLPVDVSLAWPLESWTFTLPLTLNTGWPRQGLGGWLCPGCNYTAPSIWNIMKKMRQLSSCF